MQTYKQTDRYMFISYSHRVFWYSTNKHSKRYICIDSSHYSASQRISHVRNISVNFGRSLHSDFETTVFCWFSFLVSRNVEYNVYDLCIYLFAFSAFQVLT